MVANRFHASRPSRECVDLPRSTPLKKTLRDEQKELTRQRIRRAARTLFFRKGIQNVACEDIAAEAGIARATLYLYFRNKSEILVELYNQHLYETTRIYMRLTEIKLMTPAAVTRWLKEYVDEVRANALGVNLFHADGSLDELTHTLLIEHRASVIKILGERFPGLALDRLNGAARKRRYCEADLLIDQIEGFCGSLARYSAHLDVNVAVKLLSERFFALITAEI
jgi:AcrR family transcriptional regulator